MTRTEPEENSNSDPLIGYSIDGRYRIDEFLAAGGMASVYRAHDARLGRDVACKIIHPHLANDPQLVARFHTEASSAAQLHAPSIVAVHDQGEVDGRAYLIMELVEGMNLRTALAQSGSASIGEALDVIEGVARALAAAHRRGIIHRDVKPENVLIDNDGTVKVADFGLAHAISHATGTSTGTVMGTVAYLAPELLVHGQSAAASDVYSLGIVFYELLIGATPYADEPPMRVAWHHVNDPLPLPSESASWIPTDVDDLFAALTAADSSERISDGEEAIAAIRQLRNALPAEVLNRRAPGTRNQTVPLTRVTTALPRTQSATPATRKKWRRAILVVLLILALLAACFAGWWFLAGPGKRMTIPDVTGQTAQKAEQVLHDAGIQTTRDVEYSDDIEAGHVTRTSPKPGARVGRDDKVRLYVSQGVKMVDVPSGLEGQARADVQAALKDADLTSGEITEEYSNDVKEGLLIRIAPEPGTRVRHGTPMALVFSKGREPATVPSVVGMSRADAEKAVAAAKLKPSASEDFSDTVPAGTVISQEPEPGSQAFVGDALSYVVSKGPRMVEVPNLRGKTMDEARRILSDLGLKANVRKRLLGLDPNHVYDQSPASGQSVRLGSTVTLDYV